MERQRTRASLIEGIALELKKDPGRIDPGFIDRGIDELYALDGLTPPGLDDEALDAAARTVRSRAAWRRRNTPAEGARRRRFTRRTLRGIWAACGAFLFLFSANYVTTLVSGSCLPSKAGIRICCGTEFCRCDIAEAEKESPGAYSP
jgi:hypothetical protein